jgi:hypothetical protein
MQQEFSLENIRKGLKNPERILDNVVFEYLFRIPTVALNGYRTIGTNVFDRDWDVLIILDTARVDALREVKDEYDFIEDVGSIRSVGGASAEWLARTFDESHRDKIENTAFLSAQNHIQEILDTKAQYSNNKPFPIKMLRLMSSVDINDLGKFEYIFKYETIGEDGSFGHKEGNTPPRYVTDRGIAVMREHDFERLILQYHQPHTPWFSKALREERQLKDYEYNWWDYYYQTGDLESIWEAYMSDLRFVLDDINILLENLDAEKVVITADHGEAFGEYGVLGHNIGSFHPKVRNVPWVETSATDKRTREPVVEKPNQTKMSREKMDEQLKALGYKT